MTSAAKRMTTIALLATAAACTDSSKAPAEAALAAATSSMETLTADVRNYAPEAVKKLESSYGTAKDSMANKDYQGVLTFAKDIPARAREAVAQAEATRSGLAKTWGDASGRVAKTLASAKARLDQLARSKKLPAGIDAPTLARAKADLDSLQQGWMAASDQYRNGDWKGAVDRVKMLDTQAAGLHQELGIP